MDNDVSLASTYPDVSISKTLGIIQMFLYLKHWGYMYGLHGKARYRDQQNHQHFSYEKENIRFLPIKSPMSQSTFSKLCRTFTYQYNHCLGEKAAFS